MSETTQQPQEELEKLSEALSESVPPVENQAVSEQPEKVEEQAIPEVVQEEEKVEAEAAPQQAEVQTVEQPAKEEKLAAQKPEVKVQVAQKAVVVEATNPAEKSEEEAYFDKIREAGTTEQKRCLAAIESFVQQFAPRTEIPANKATRIQNEFLGHLLWAIEKDYDVFKACWSVFAVYFSAYHGVNTPQKHSALSEYNTNRYLHAWDKGEDRCFAYRDLITLLRATRNKETRRHDVKTINLDKIGQNVVTERGRSNLKQFYGV